MRLNPGNLLRVVSTIAVLMTLFVPAVEAQKQPADSPAGVKLQPLNVKPGLWEATTRTTVAGEMPIPAEMLNRLSPDQRARMEARMKANSNAHTNTETHQSCVTKEDLEKQRLHFGEPANGECKSTILSSTSTSAKAKISCDVEGMTGNGTYEVEAVDPEHVKGTSHATMTGNDRTMNVNGTFTSKWLGASCGSVK